jgi:hypothetical protein
MASKAPPNLEPAEDHVVMSALLGPAGSVGVGDEVDDGLAGGGWESGEDARPRLRRASRCGGAGHPVGTNDQPERVFEVDNVATNTVPPPDRPAQSSRWRSKANQLLCRNG